MGRQDIFILGRLGALELAGRGLSIGFTNITGYSVLFGLALGMDPICSQAFGSKNWEIIGLSLQRTILILLTAYVPISFLWVNLKNIMSWMSQDARIATFAATYCLFSLPDLVTNSILQPLRVYLRSQGITTPMMCCSVIALVAHVPLNILLVFVLHWGVPGVAIAAVLTNLNMVFLLVGYLYLSGTYKRTWKGWSVIALREWWTLLKLALPSCVTICLTWWWYEIMTLLAGCLPNPQEAVAITAILIQTTSLMYTLPMALSSSVSTHVGNELGACRPERARLASIVALGCSIFIALIGVTWTTLLKDEWGKVFTNDKSVRGSARPTIGARINLGSFYFLGTLVAVALAF